MSIETFTSIITTIGCQFFYGSAVFGLLTIFPIFRKSPFIDKFNTIFWWTGVLLLCLSAFILTPGKALWWCGIPLTVMVAIRIWAQIYIYRHYSKFNFVELTTKYLTREDREGDEVHDFYGSSSYEDGKHPPISKQTVTFYAIKEVEPDRFNPINTLYLIVDKNAKPTREAVDALNLEYSGNYTRVWHKLIVAEKPLKYNFWKNNLNYVNPPERIKLKDIA